VPQPVGCDVVVGASSAGKDRMTSWGISGDAEHTGPI
jgi:hypothetical protein